MLLNNGDAIPGGNSGDEAENLSCGGNTSFILLMNAWVSKGCRQKSPVFLNSPEQGDNPLFAVRTYALSAGGIALRVMLVSLPVRVARRKEITGACSLASRSESTIVLLEQAFHGADSGMVVLAAIFATCSNSTHNHANTGSCSPLESRRADARKILLVGSVDKDGALFSTVTVQITLCVTIDVEPPNQPPSLHRLLPHGRVNDLPAPCDLAETTHVD